MKSKLFLTSLTAIAIAMPAMAEPSNTESTFPSNELMLQDTTYQNQANYTNMGLYEGTVTANAEYDWDIITVNPGQYIPANSTTAATCTPGNYCLGMTSNQQDQTPHYSDTVQGLSQCPANYSNSAEGSDASTDCYRTCTTTDVAHSANVTGMMYYNGTNGDGVNACEPTEQNGCVNGYHYVAGASDLSSVIGTQAGQAYAAVNNSGNDLSGGNASTYGLSTTNDHNAFVVDYGNGKKVWGHGGCSTQTGIGMYNGASGPEDITTSNEVTVAFGTGDQCWCQLDGYTLTNGAKQSLSGPWVYHNTGGNAAACALNCSGTCASQLNYNGTNNALAFRAAVLGSVTSGFEPTLASCTANTITINWNGASQTDINANNAGTATYDGDIRTPRAAEQITGKTFKGWRFEKPTPSQGD